jgi:hypothetical protein
MTKQGLGMALLLTIPPLTYLVSYILLAWYHGSPALWNVIVHEGGTYTFGQTMFYASHFLGHVPVIVLAALLMAGSYACMTSPLPDFSGWRWASVTLLAGVLLGSVPLSLAWFGTEDTVQFLLQNKQSVVTSGQGGSWNLHLPSSIQLFAVIPLVVLGAKLLTGRSVRLTPTGLPLLVAALALLLSMTMMVNRENLSSAAALLAEPRYVAHGIRELATFPLTFFPWVLFMLHGSEPANSARPPRRAIAFFVVGSVLFGSVLLAQSLFVLSHGVGALAQKPSFARGGELSIPYLLASHYFEHFLDTFFFFGATLFFLSLLARKKP